MENAKDLQIFLNQISDPAFLVRDNKIIAVNVSGARFSVILDKPVSELMMTGQEEYAGLQDGSLLLTLHILGTEYGCSVSKLAQGDLFVLREPTSQADLEALSLAAKQLRGPLSEMSVTLETMNSEDSDQKAKLNRSIHQLQRIIGNMSDTVRIQAANGSPVTCDVCALFAELLEKASVLLDRSGIQLEYQLPEKAIFAPVDQELLTRSVYNLISNAVKFGGKDGAIHAVLKCKGNKLYFSVANTGLPVTKELLGSMFSRYSRRPGIEDPRYGIGLGMTIIHKAASLHGGTVLVENLPESGTRITMTLAIRNGGNLPLRSSTIRPDLYGGRDQALVELSEVLSYAAFM